MSHSMTAYAQRVEATPWGDITCELRSVNHRYLEISPRLGEELRHMEPEVRETIGKKIKRGRVECTMRLQSRGEWSDELELDVDRVRRMVAVAEKLQAEIPVLEPLRTIDVMRWPGILRSAEYDQEGLAKATLTALEAALKEFVAVRRREGDRLMELLRQRLGEMDKIVAQVRTLLPDVYAAFRERIQTRLGEVRNEMDPARLEQEMVVYIQRADVAEEVDRLGVHLEELAAVLKQDQPVGRRLDFLMQEINREANTLGSKSVDTRLTQASVELKVLIDQMREQIQNIE